MKPADPSGDGRGRRGGDARGRNPGLSLTRKLPLQFAVVMTAVLACFVAIAYSEVRRSAAEANADRIQRVNQTFSQSAAETQATWRERVSDAAAEPAVARFLQDRDPQDPSFVSATDRVVAGDTLNHLELWGPEGTPVFTTARFSPRTEHRSQARALLGQAPVDSARTGSIYLAGTELHFWVVAPIVSDTEVPPGYVALRRRIPAPVAAEETIRDLLGPSVRIYLTSEGWDHWAGLLGAPPAVIPSPIERPGGFFTFEEPNGEAWVAHAAPVAGTGWTLITARPEGAVLRPVRSFMLRSGLAAAVLLLLGISATGVMSRRLTSPLRRLSGVAEAIAGGEYHRRAVVTRKDEVGQLAATFNQMAAEVEKSHGALEGQVSEARRLARELTRSNRRLREARNEADRARAEAESAAVLALQARDEAEAADRAKSHFLATMSHEIRTPLNAITGYADLMDAEIAGPLTPQQRMQLERIRRSSDHLKELVDDLLDLTKIEAGEFSVRSVPADLADSMSGAVELARPNASARGIDLSLARPTRGDALYIGDPRRVRQILGNLLSNAIKFTPSGGRITVSGGPGDGPDAPPHVFVSVEDDGPGIPAEHTERIFDPFVQLETGYTRTRGGAGLGLPISRRLARLMGGDLTVRSEVGRGSSFTLWLPDARRGGDGPVPGSRTDEHSGTEVRDPPTIGPPETGGKKEMESASTAREPNDQTVHRGQGD